MPATNIGIMANNIKGVETPIKKMLPNMSLVVSNIMCRKEDSNLPQPEGNSSTDCRR